MFIAAGDRSAKCLELLGGSSADLSDCFVLSWSVGWVQWSMAYHTDAEVMVLKDPWFRTVQGIAGYWLPFPF